MPRMPKSFRRLSSASGTPESTTATPRALEFYRFVARIPAVMAPPGHQAQSKDFAKVTTTSETPAECARSAYVGQILGVSRPAHPLQSETYAPAPGLFGLSIAPPLSAQSLNAPRL
jgi:hypothetical protein